MSGTLQPTKMYGSLLGASRKRPIFHRVYRSPFPPGNLRVLITPDVSTVYRERTPETYDRISEYLIKVCNGVYGNVAVFFPSYQFLERIQRSVADRIPQRMVAEERGMGKRAKNQLLEVLRRNQGLHGALLLGVMGGSLSESIDYRDNLLAATVVVGIPFAPPNLVVRETRSYFDRKFPGKGDDYAYVAPAINRVIQAAGRGIRSETDRQVVVLVDRRWTQPRYRGFLPPEWSPLTTRDVGMEVTAFYSQ
jgi:DNA excision repair protein ERCC-2